MRRLGLWLLGAAAVMCAGYGGQLEAAHAPYSHLLYAASGFAIGFSSLLWGDR